MALLECICYFTQRPCMFYGMIFGHMIYDITTSPDIKMFFVMVYYEKTRSRMLYRTTGCGGDKGNRTPDLVTASHAL